MAVRNYSIPAGCVPTRLGLAGKVRCSRSLHRVAVFLLHRTGLREEVLHHRYFSGEPWGNLFFLWLLAKLELGDRQWCLSNLSVLRAETGM